MTLVERMQETFSAQIVYGDPIEKDGTLLLPAAWVDGGGGGGSASEESGDHGDGGGFGLLARPSGSWVVTGEGPRWVSDIDLTAILLAGSLLLMSYLRYRRSRQIRSP